LSKAEDNALLNTYLDIKEAFYSIKIIRFHRADSFHYMMGRRF